ncbi:hypothetical protein WJX73_005165 [Symbiochloris irregularis]|uniref:Fanconi-associated nuclease n=1 Tax=Symbiochloris irregularis TaxID=706552 RepID=A0AAW1NU78_9CHLO
MRLSGIRKLAGPSTPAGGACRQRRWVKAVAQTESDFEHHLDNCLAQRALERSSAQKSDLGRTPSAPVPVSVEVQPAPDASGDLVQQAMHQATAACLAHQDQNLKRVPSGTGNILRTNFLLVIDTVTKHDGALLVQGELDMLDTFRGLPDPAQALFLRLFQRSGPWFRQRTLDYSEVPDVNAAVTQLINAGFARQLLHSTIHRGMDGVAEMLTVVELTGLLAGAHLMPKRGASAIVTKASLVGIMQTALDESVEQQQALGGAILGVTGPLLRLDPSAVQLVHRLRRLFFLNEGQDFSRFLVSDLGITKYPQYRTSRHLAAFPDRQALLDYELALQQGLALDSAFEDGDAAAVEAALVPALAAVEAGQHKLRHLTGPAAEWLAQVKAEAPFLLRYSAAHIHTAMCTTAVSLLEKQRKYQEATELLQQLLGGELCKGRRGEWWLRLSMDTQHMGRPEHSLELAETALADENVRHGDRLALQRRVLRLGKPPRRWKRPPWAAQACQEPMEVRIEACMTSSALGLKSRFLVPESLGGGEDTLGVEQLALLYYASPEGGGWTGKHSENGIWATLFGLLMWEVLFMDVPGAFRTPFQTSPLDLPTPLFYPARQQAIEARLAELRAGAGPHLLQRRYNENRSEICSGVNWEREGLEELVEIATCVGGSGLAAVCQLLAEDHSGWAGGMPDLLLWKPGEAVAKLSEVKGPRDRLSDQQRAWITALTSAGVRCEVLKVLEPKAAGSKRGKR